MDHILNAHALAPFLDKLRAQQPALLVALGDSNTCNAEFTAGAKQWPELLHSELRSCYKTQAVMLVNAGVSGTTVLDGLARLDETVLRFGPDLCIVSFGSNDAGRLTSERFHGAMNELVDRLQAAGALVLIRTSPPVMELEPPPPHVWKNDQPHWTLMAVNVDIARSRGLALIDNHAMWRELEAAGRLDIRPLMHDCVHLNALGHQLIVRQMAPAFGMPATFHWERHETDAETQGR